MLNERDKLIHMVSARHKAVLAELKEVDKSYKDICGFDARLTWSDEEFELWRSTAEGRVALESGTLPPPPLPTAVSTSPTTTQTTTKPEPLTNGNTTTTPSLHPDTDPTDSIGPGTCKRKRCERHRAWLKNQQTDNAFEKDLCRQGIRRLEGEEKSVGDRAVLRALEGDEGGWMGGLGLWMGLRRVNMGCILMALWEGKRRDDGAGNEG